MVWCHWGGRREALYLSPLGGDIFCLDHGGGRGGGGGVGVVWCHWYGRREALVPEFSGRRHLLSGPWCMGG